MAGHLVSMRRGKSSLQPSRRQDRPKQKGFPRSRMGEKKAAETGRLRRRLETDGYRVLSRRFYLRSPGEVARAILGKYLVRSMDGTLLVGRIVEAEAYYGRDDPASHAFRGITGRNREMFAMGGTAYIYLAYGNHFLINIVTGRVGVPGAVLIRALEPVQGMREMGRLRRTTDVSRLTNGPGRLTEALGIHGEDSGCDLTDSSILICRRIGERSPDVAVSPRIGISRGKEFNERYYVPGNPFVSSKPNW